MSSGIAEAAWRTCRTSPASVDHWHLRTRLPLCKPTHPRDRRAYHAITALLHKRNGCPELRSHFIYSDRRGSAGSRRRTDLFISDFERYASDPTGRAAEKSCCYDCEA